MKGFTLIELLITIAILAVIAVIGGLNLFSYYSRQNLELTVNEITALIRQAQGEGWGVRLENADQDSVKLFCCESSYSSSTQISAYVLRASTQFTDPGPGISKDVIFSKITGLPLIPVTIKIALVGNSAASSTITINENGVIQY